MSDIDKNKHKLVRLSRFSTSIMDEFNDDITKRLGMRLPYDTIVDLVFREYDKDTLYELYKREILKLVK